jgi:hypothetical protein
MNKKPLTELEEAGLEAHGLDVGTPSQLSDVFRHGIAWAIENNKHASKSPHTALHDWTFLREMKDLLNEGNRDQVKQMIEDWIDALEEIL